MDTRRVIRLVISLAVAAVALAGCGDGDGGGGEDGGGGGGGKYQYHFVLPAPAGDVEDAEVVVNGAKKGKVSGVEERGAESKADVGLDEPLRQSAKTRVCNGQLQIEDGPTSVRPALSGYTFPASQAVVGCG